MKNEKFLELLNNIDDKYILEADRKKRKNSKRNLLLTIAASFVLVFGITLKNGTINNIINYENNLNKMSSPSSEPRRILQYNKNIYEFLENENSVKKEDLDKELGEIKFDLLEDEKNYNKDLSATFGIGGKIYSLKEYNKDFRVAVVYKNKIYICEKVDEIDKKVNIEEYFKNANLINLTKYIEVYDHFGMEKQKVVEGELAKELLSSLEKSEDIILSDEDYEKIASAQGNGGSFLLKAVLKDKTTFDFYILPELQLVMIGDNTFKITDSAKEKILNLTKDINKENLIKNIAF